MSKVRRILTFAFVVTDSMAMAQTWSISAKSNEIAFGSTIYIESTYQRAGAPARVKDTISGTAFLIADSDKVYLVTAKHVVTATLTAKNQHLVNNNIFISTTGKSSDKGLKLNSLSAYPARKRPFVLSSDGVDLAIISLQKNKYKYLLAALLKQDCKPIAIDSIDTAPHHPGEFFFLPAYALFINKHWNKEKQHGVSPGTIKSYPEAGAVFTIDHFISQGNNGAPLLLNDKVIGILRNEDGILTNSDIVSNPYRTAQSATAIKAAYILPLLRKLQQNENIAGYN